MSQLLRRAQLAEDRELIARCAAAAALLGVEGPTEWAQRKAWDFAITKGWEGDGPSSVNISDASIVARVAELAGKRLPEPEPEPEGPEDEDEGPEETGSEMETP